MSALKFIVWSFTNEEIATFLVLYDEQQKSDYNSGQNDTLNQYRGLCKNNATVNECCRRRARQHHLDEQNSNWSVLPMMHFQVCLERTAASYLHMRANRG